MSARLRRQYAAYCQLYGDAARERGHANELRLLAAVLSLRSGATWIRDARAATPEEDAAGADVVVTADVGTLYLQSKSSIVGAREFTSAKRPISVEAVVVSLDDAATAARALLALSALREEKIRARPVPTAKVATGTKVKLKAWAAAHAEQLAYEAARRALRAARRFAAAVTVVAQYQSRVDRLRRLGCALCDGETDEHSPWMRKIVDRGGLRIRGDRSLCSACCATMDSTVAELNERASATSEAA